MRKLLIVGNWKMNGSEAQISTLLQQLMPKLRDLRQQVDCVLCPPSIYMYHVHEVIKLSNMQNEVQLGAQNVASSVNPAFTGEISPAMLREFGCSYVIIGHSERRMLLLESDDLVASKFQLSAENSLTPILCVGETKEQQVVGDSFKIVANQIRAVIAKVGIAAFASAVIAYEPIWAIGTGLTATPEQAQDMHAYIRSVLAEYDTDIAVTSRIIYGGSVNSTNAVGLLQQADIDGSLVGGAALKAQDFSEICHIAMGMTK